MRPSRTEWGTRRVAGFQEEVHEQRARLDEAFFGPRPPLDLHGHGGFLPTDPPYCAAARVCSARITGVHRQLAISTGGVAACIRGGRMIAVAASSRFPSNLARCIEAGLPDHGLGGRVCKHWALPTDW